MRYAGSPFSFQADAINIYQVQWFQSYEAFSSTDSPDLIPYGGSLIVTGRSTWTLYEYAIIVFIFQDLCNTFIITPLFLKLLSSPYYTGYRVCVTPADIMFAYPGFFPTAADFGFSGRGKSSTISLHYVSL